MKKPNNNKKKAVVGRPTKYKKEYCEQLIEHFEEGFSYGSFAGKIGVNQDTLYEWEKVHPEYSESKKIGYSKSMYYWEKLGLSGIKGETTGKFAASPFIFMMKCRFRDEYSDIVEDKKDPVININISKDEVGL